MTTKGCCPKTYLLRYSFFSLIAILPPPKDAVQKRTSFIFSLIPILPLPEDVVQKRTYDNFSISFFLAGYIFGLSLWTLFFFPVESIYFSGLSLSAEIET